MPSHELKDVPDHGEPRALQDLVDRAAAQLSEHFDSVVIITTHYFSDKDGPGTRRFSWAKK